MGRWGSCFYMEAPDFSSAWWWSDCRWSVWCRWTSAASRDGRSQKADGRPPARGSAHVRNGSQPEQTSQTEKTGDSAISNTWLQHDFNFKSPVRVPVVMHNLLFLLGPWLFCAINRWYWPWKAVLRWRGNMVLTSPPHPSYQKHRRFVKSPGLRIVRTYPEPRLHSRTSDWCRNCPRESKNIQYSIQ